MGDAAEPPRLPVKVCRFEVCRKKSVLRGMRWTRSSETKAGEGEDKVEGMRVRRRETRENGRWCIVG
jgi:hypothetical protein